MRMLAGTTWGCTKKSMLIIYKQLIRPILDYGAIAYSSACKKHLDRLEHLQNQAMRIATGAMHGTRTDALQVDCGITSLCLRRLAQQIDFAVKIKSTADHVSEDVLLDHWTNHYGKFKLNNLPFRCKTDKFFQDNPNLNYAPTALGKLQPWLYKEIIVNTDLANHVSKKDSPEMILSLAMDLIDQYKTSTCFYTDASRTKEGLVGIGTFSPQHEIRISLRISNNVSIYTGEMLAIKTAILNYIQIKDNRNGSYLPPLVIFSDSLSVLKTIQNNTPSSRPDITTDIMELAYTVPDKISLVWIPSHVGIPGNETADELANKATSNKEIDRECKLSYQENKRIIHQYINNIWQENWKKSNSQYSKIQPLVSTTVKYTCTSRGKERLITRLRLDQCQLNHYLHKIGVHQSGLCEQCQVPETTLHYLLQCPQTKIPELLNVKCRELQMEATLGNILSNKETCDIIFRNTHRRL